MHAGEVQLEIVNHIVASVSYNQTRQYKNSNMQVCYMRSISYLYLTEIVS